jgi:hypothetical protein
MLTAPTIQVKEKGMNPRFVLIVALLLGTPSALSSQTVPDRPFLVSSTYWGGSSTEDASAVVVDAAGNVYVAGTTRSTNFPRTVFTLPALGNGDVFVSKFNAAGTLIFSTVFGGSSSERLSRFAVDAGGNIIIAGETFSSDLPVMNAIQPTFHMAVCGEFGGICSDGFVAKLNPNGGSLVFSTYLGTDRIDVAHDVAVDGAGNVYVAGETEMPFAGVVPIRPFSGNREGFVAKIPPAGGAFAYFTYLGGTSLDVANAIAADPAGNVHVTGATESTNFPILNPIQAVQENFSNSAFVTKLNPSGIIAYSTYLGGNDQDFGIDIAVDAAGRAHVVGHTRSTNFPTANARQPFLRGFSDAFVAKLSASGSSLEYSTYLGGAEREQRLGILDFGFSQGVALDAAGNAYVTGVTQSSDFPAVSALRPFGGGVCIDFPLFETMPCPDAYVTKLAPSGQFAFSTPFGGTREDRGRGIAVSPEGLVHVVGTAMSPDFPVLNALQASLSGGSDAFIARISTAPPACQLPAPVQLSPGGGILDPQPTFSWEAVAGAEAYVVLAVNVAQFLLTGTPPIQTLGITAGTSLTPSAPMAPGDYLWLATAWNSSCGFGATGQGLAFTQPGTCPTPPATLLTPSGGAVVPNPVVLSWQTPVPRSRLSPSL